MTGLDDRYPVAADRLTQAGAAIRDGLRSGTGTTTGDTIGLGVLTPLDAFVAAVDALTRTATAHAATGTGAAAVDNAARALVRAAAALETAVLSTLDAMLADRAGDLQRQQQILLGAVALAAVALVGVLLLGWVGMRRPAPGPRSDHPGGHADPPTPRGPAAPVRGGDLVAAGVTRPFPAPEPGGPLPRRAGERP
ncbi:hypothetical protein ACFQX7_39480 [Luedemannella flava]